jgi:hypothetical protein
MDIVNYINQMTMKTAHGSCVMFTGIREVSPNDDDYNYSVIDIWGNWGSYWIMEDPLITLKRLRDGMEQQLGLNLISATVKPFEDEASSVIKFECQYDSLKVRLETEMYVSGIDKNIEMVELYFPGKI